jgi:hypothetical protein
MLRFQACQFTLPVSFICAGATRACVLQQLPFLACPGGQKLRSGASYAGPQLPFLAWPGGHFGAGVSWNTGTGTTAQPASRALASSAAILGLFMSDSCFLCNAAGIAAGPDGC